MQAREGYRVVGPAIIISHMWELTACSWTTARISLAYKPIGDFQVIVCASFVRYPAHSAVLSVMKPKSLTW
jgi:hypothetical protein